MRTSSKKSIVNEQIDAEQVRLVGEEGEQLGIVTISEAREKAAAIKLDLVLISPEAEPPVCKLMDYGKHIFEAKKNKKLRTKRSNEGPK
jgi:translation initiation factor IF-3